MSRNAQNSGLAVLNPMGKGVSGHFTKNYFDGKVHGMSRSAHKYSNLPTSPIPLLWGMGESLLQGFLEIVSSVKHWI